MQKNKFFALGIFFLDWENMCLDRFGNGADIRPREGADIRPREIPEKSPDITHDQF